MNTFEDVLEYCGHWKSIALTLFWNPLYFLFAKLCSYIDFSIPVNPATASPAHSRDNCPLLGPSFLPPKRLSQSPLVDSAKTAFVKALEQHKYGSSSPNSTTFSVSVFSINEQDSIFEYHNTAPGVRESPIGTQLVKSDSVYRIASIRKLFVVWTLLREVGDKVLHQPITKYIPELQNFPSGHHDKHIVYNDLDFTTWEDVTIGGLASQTADVARWVNGGYRFTDEATEQAGFPKSYPLEDPECGWLDKREPCSREMFFKALLNTPPSFPASTTPAYSNLAFQLIGYALEDITGKSMQSMVEETCRTVGLTDTSYDVPANYGNGVIPRGNVPAMWWNVTAGDENPAGSMFSSTRDLIRAGRAILSSSTLPPALTRRWLKPASHTSDLYSMVGAPFEIRRILLSNGRIVDLYTKSGGMNLYASSLMLSPDLGIGFTFLAALDPDSPIVRTSVDTVQNALVGEFLERIEDVARQEAADSFSGTYAAQDGGNSSMKLSVDEEPGVKIDNFLSRGKETFKVRFQGENIELRLFPTGSRTEERKKKGEETFVKSLGFRMVTNFLDREVVPGNFISDCTSWGFVGSDLYGGLPLDAFIFGFGEDGRVQYIENRALKLRLNKVS